MKKIGFLLILCSIISGCAGSKVLSIPQNYTLKAPQNSIVIGRLSIENIEGVFGNCMVTLATKDWSQEFPISIPEGQRVALPKGGWRYDFYFYVEMPPGQYDFKGATVEHERFHDLKFYMLNANLTIPESSIVFIGNLTVSPIGRTLNLLGPTTEMYIDKSPDDVIQKFRQRYPEYNGRDVKVKVMSRYELFKEGGIGGLF